MESSNKGLLFVDNDDCRDKNNWYKAQADEKEESGFSQPKSDEDENGAGGELGTSHDSEYANDSPGGAGSAGSAANNEEE